MNKVELLAPAGNYESFLGAIHAGADAVYLGGSKFGARAYADNFTEEELCNAIKYAHLFGKRVYLTLNTLIKDKEFEELYDYLYPFYVAGLDGVIVQDMGVFSYVKRNFPHLPLHISTQMTITGGYGAEFLKKEGAVRIVPARELSLKEIRQMKDKTGLEIETFIHGAMCYCYSGQCLFSSVLGGRSGNRGKCAQPCRLPYSILEGGKTLSGKVSEYPLSLKDMCTINHIPDLIEAGIDSFKIEGRMKKAEYAAGVTAIYRKYIDLYYKKGREGFRVSKDDMKMLEALYIRSEIQDGYYYRHNGREMITEDKPGYSGSDDRILNQVRRNYLEKSKMLPIKMQAYFYKDREAVLTVSCNDEYVTVTGMLVQSAMKQPVTKENIRAGLSSLGDTAFELKELEIDCEEDIFYPLKAIKDLRRMAIAKLEEQLIADAFPELTLRVNTVESVCSKDSISKKKCNNNNLTDRVGKEALTSICVFVTQRKQLQGVLHSEVAIDKLYLDADLCSGVKDWEELLENLRQQQEQKDIRAIYITLPYILRQRDELYLENLFSVLEKADGCMVRNIEGYAYLTGNNYQKEIGTDAGFYQWNQECRDFWSDKISSVCVPYELNAKEQDILVKNNWEKVVYGRLPMMISANCIANTSEHCLMKRKVQDFDSRFLYSLKDRYKTEFPTYINCNHCYNVIYNSVPLSLHDKVKARGYGGKIRLDFTVEEETETMKIVRYFDGLMKGMEPDRPYAEYTTGHEKKGVL